MSLGFAASMGIAGGLDTVEKYSYQEWLNQQQLKTDQLRREADLKWRKDTLDDELEMERRRQMAAADTQMEIFERQAPMRKAQNQEAIDFKLDELKQLTPAEIEAKLATEEAMQEFTRQLRERFFDEDQAFAAKTAESQQNLQQKAVLRTREFMESMDMPESLIDRVSVRLLSDMDPLANTGAGRGGTASSMSYKDLGQQRLQEDVRNISDLLERRLNERLPDGTPTSVSKGDTGSDARDAMRVPVREFVNAVSSGNLSKAEDAVRDMMKMTSPDSNAWMPTATRLEKFVKLFDDDKHFKRIMAPKNEQEFIESMQFRQANLPAFRIFEGMSDATEVVNQTGEQADAALAAPGSYGPNYTRNDAITDVRGAAAEAGMNIDDTVLQELN